jgi:hypothetical protein
MKTPSRPLALALWSLPLALGLATPLDELSYAPAPGTSVTRRIQIETEVSLEENRLEVDGQDPSLPSMDITMESSRLLAVTDTYTTPGARGPERLERTFDEVASRTHITGSNPATGDQDIEVPGSSELEGKTVVFTWSTDDEAYELAFAEGSEGDQDLLRGLEEELDLRGFLPGKEVSEGDAWEIPVEAVRRLLAPGGKLKIEPDADDERFQGMGGFDQFDPSDMVGALEGEFQATYAGTRSEGDSKVAVIRLELSAKAVQDLSPQAARMRDNLPEELQLEIEAFDGEFSLEAEGELTWDLAAGLPRALEVRGDLTMIVDVSMTMRAGKREQSLENSMTFAGTETITYSTGE